MPRFKNKKSYKRVQRLRDRQKKESGKYSKIFDKKFTFVVRILFFLGLFLAFFNPIFSLLMLFFLMDIGESVFNKVSKVIFGKPFEPFFYNRFSKLHLSDAFLSLIFYIFLAVCINMTMKILTLFQVLAL